jgi:hypothetical protein
MHNYRVIADALHRHGCRPTAIGQDGLGCKAYCPAHDDEEGRNPSLTVNVKNGRLVLHCWVGCKWEAIVDALGLRWEEVFPDLERGNWVGSHRREKRRPGFPRLATPPAAPDDKPTDWAALADDARKHAMLPEHRCVITLLADRLGVLEESLHRLGIGWRKSWARSEPWSKPHWTFLFRDGNGINCRWPQGSKRTQAGGKNGLIYDPDLRNVRTGVLYCVEGATDTAAGMTIGLTIAGRAVRWYQRRGVR